MKKTLSIVLALAIAIAMFSSFALIAAAPDATNPFTLNSILVTDLNGYTNPYMAVDNAALFVENQVAYVALSATLRGSQADDGDTVDIDLAATEYNVTVASSTLDLSYATSTARYQSTTIDDGAKTILPAAALVAGDPIDVDDDSPLVFEITPTQPNDEDDYVNYFWSFVAVTKPATAGLVTASLAVTATVFDTVDMEDVLALPVFENGVLKYTIVRATTPTTLGVNYAVFAGAAFNADDTFNFSNYLFTYVQDGSNTIVNGDSIGYDLDTADVLDPDTINVYVEPLSGKIFYLGTGTPPAIGGTGTAADKDITADVTAVNMFFGFSFAAPADAGNGAFEVKTIGNPIVISDTYNMFTAVVTDGDGVDIAPTGDFSANIVIVMAASAVLAAAALAFVAKKARD